MASTDHDAALGSTGSNNSRHDQFDRSELVLMQSDPGSVPWLRRRMQTTLDEQWVSTFADEHGDWTLKPEDHAIRDADHKQPTTGHVVSEVEQQRNLL